MSIFGVGNDKKTKKEGFIRLKPIILFAFCFFIFTPKFKIPLVADAIISYGVPIFYIVINANKICRMNRRQLLLLAMVALLVGMSISFPLMHGTQDFSLMTIILTVVKKIITFSALLCLIVNNHGNKNCLHYFLYYYIMTNVTYVIGTLLLVSIPSLYDLWFSLVEKVTMVGNYAGRTFRIGWLGFSGFRSTLYCTISVAFAFYLRYGAKKPAINGRQFIVSIILCITGNMFYGRSGLILSALTSILALAVWNRKNMKKIIISIIAVAVAVMGISLLKNVPGLGDWYRWMSSPIINLVTTGEMNDKSFDRLQEMQQVEIGMDTMITGDGYYNYNGHYYMRTDAGFVRNILFWGIIGAGISYGITLYSIWGFSQINKLLIIQFLIIFVAFEYKGAVYYEFIPIAFAISTALKISDQDESLKRRLL